MQDPRYDILQALADRGDRATYLARDLLTNRSVVLKQDRAPFLVHEMAALLSLPLGIAPQVLDALWNGSSFLMVLEQLRGKTLFEASPSLGREELPPLVHSISQCLIHMHRSGWIHCDIKPSNIFLVEDGGGMAVRLLDLGFARAATGAYLPADDDLAGGTPPFIAPEVLRGWAVDARADQYSLGMTLTRLFPWLTEDGHWAGILDRLCERSPSKRYPHVAALRDEIAETFGLPPHPDRFPKFGSGGLVGRREELDRIVEAVLRKKPPACLLLQSRPSMGRTRLLLEAQMTIASKKGPAARAIDLGDIPSQSPGDVMRRFLEERVSSGETVLLGIPDPSPGLRWTEDQTASWLRGLSDRKRGDRVFLRELSAGDLAEIIASSLGGKDAGFEQLSEELHEAAEGLLQETASGFDTVVRKLGREAGLTWTLAPDGLDDALAGWQVACRELSLEECPHRIRRAMQVAAAVGLEVREAETRELLGAFCGNGSWDALIDHGILSPVDERRHRWLARRLRNEALKPPLPERKKVYAWLLDHVTPDMGQPREVLDACRWAREVGRRDLERKYLGDALRQSDERLTWHNTVTLLGYPDGLPRKWSTDGIIQSLHRVEETLGPGWKPEEITWMAARALAFLNNRFATPLLEQLAESPDRSTAWKALAFLAEMSSSDSSVFQEYLARLEDTRSDRCDVIPGVLEYLRGCHARFWGRNKEALSLIETAVERLEGTGDFYEIPSQIALATLLFAQSPKRALDQMKSSLERVRYPIHVPVIYRDLAQMYEYLGDLESYLESCEKGLRSLEGRRAQGRENWLRLNSAVAHAWLDRIEEAEDIARRLLQLSSIKAEKNTRVLLRSTLAFCAMHRGRRRAALLEASSSWEEARLECPHWTQVFALQILAEVLLDMGAGEQVRENEPSMRLSSDEGHPSARLLQTRIVALRQQASDELERARATLIAERGRAARHTVPIDGARYLHHLGVVSLELARKRGSTEEAEEGAEVFHDSLKMLDTTGYGYYRSRMHLGLSRALRICGHTSESESHMNQAIELAQRIGSQALLATCLRERATLNLV